MFLENFEYEINGTHFLSYSQLSTFWIKRHDNCEEFFKYGCKLLTGHLENYIAQLKVGDLCLFQLSSLNDSSLSFQKAPRTIMGACIPPGRCLKLSQIKLQLYHSFSVFLILSVSVSICWWSRTLMLEKVWDYLPRLCLYWASVHDL